MATIILKYDARNTFAKKTINYILSLGIFEKQEPKSLTGIEKAIQEVEQGNVVKCKDFADYKRKTQDV